MVKSLPRNNKTLRPLFREKALHLCTMHLLLVITLCTVTPSNAGYNWLEFPQPGICTDKELSENMRTYINELVDVAQEHYDSMKSLEFEHVRMISEKIGQAFAEAGCQHLWFKSFTRYDRDNIRYGKFLQTYNSNKPDWRVQVTSDVVEAVGELEKYLWTMMRDHIFGRCFVSKGRDLIIEWIVTRCERGMFKYLTDGLKDFPIPSLYNDAELLKNLQAEAAMAAIALTQAIECGDSKEVTDRLVGSIVKNVNSDLCFAAFDAFQTDACFARFVENCPKFHACFENYLMDFKALATETFLGDTSIVSKCAQRSRKYWGRNKPANVPSLSQLLTGGIRLYRKIQKIDWMAESQPFARAMYKALLHPDTCECNKDDVIPDEFKAAFKT